MESPQGREALQLIRWGVIGPGRAAGRFAQGLTDVESASLAAVWGRSFDRTQAFALRFQVPQAHTTLESLLTADIDAVYIATHPDTHARLSIQALAAGKHVLCEKPAALNVRQLEGILAAGRRHERLVM